MVKIINGEILADDDPRLRQPPQPPPSNASMHSEPAYGEPVTLRPRPPAGAAVGGGRGTGFDLNAPPLRLVPPAPGSQPLLGLPDMEIFGVLVTPYAVLAVAALGMMMGWRGVMVALILYYVYLSSQNRMAEQGQGRGGTPQAGQGPAHQQQQQQQRQQQQGLGGNLMDFLQNYLNGPQPRSARGQAGQGGARLGGSDDAPPPGQHHSGGGGAGSGSGSGGSSGWAAFQGKGNKLGGAAPK